MSKDVIIDGVRYVPDRDAYTHGYFDGNDAAALKINAG